MNITPDAVVQVLKSMCGQRRKKAVGGDHPSTAAAGRSRDEGRTASSTQRVRSGSRGKTAGLSRSDPRK